MIKTLRRRGGPAIALLLASIALISAGILSGPVTRVHAAAFVVSNLNDSGPGSLRQAIIDAGNTSSRITFGVSGTISLTSGKLTVADTAGLTIDGTGANITIDATANALNGIFFIAGGANVTLTNLTLSNGTHFHGGAIENDGTLLLTSMTLLQNIASNGGGIYNIGNLTVNNSTITKALAINMPGGFGGGIYNTGGMVSVTNSTITQANAVNSGGGIANFGVGTVTVTGSTISAGQVLNDGGGIYNSSGTVTITNSTISGNSTVGGNGGGIANRSTLSVTSSTISNNTAGDLGGGVFNTNTLTVGDDIIAGNSGFNGPTDITADCRPGMVAAKFINNGHDVFGIGTGCTAAATDVFVAPGAVNSTVLGPLANNGGPTQTMALLSGSPAIDLVPASGAGCLPTDQLGTTRPQGAACDAGAFEVVVAPAAPAAAARAIVLPTGPLLGIGHTGCGTVTPPEIPAGVGLGAKVTLTAAACPGSTFVSWSGGPCDGITVPTCTFTILTGAIPAITANFAP